MGILIGCGDGDEARSSGALVKVTTASRVGVLLDELPGDARDRAAADLLARPAEFWTQRAQRQLEASLYRLLYRNFFYTGRGQLPLPPVERWNIAIHPAERATIDGHDLVTVAYDFESTLLTALDEPGRADPALANVGGTVDEAFVLPVDPEHLFERTGYACMNESDFPPHSVDTENAPTFYDDSCQAGLEDGGCHLTEPIPTMSCVTAVTGAIGHVDTTLHFARVAWDAELADAVRVGAPRPGGPQLIAVQDGVKDHRIVYRYFAEDSCAITEGCVGAAGWRRLLQFTATMSNIGDQDMVLGDVGPDSAAVKNHLVSFSACHQHMHFNHYGKFSLGAAENLGSKRAFCLESTNRYFNTETTPLVHPYTCENQGTVTGWGDDYIAGLDCQWIDITPVDATGGITAQLSFEVNPDGFLCEGKRVVDKSGEPLFEPTTFTNEAGEIENRFQCERLPDAAADNQTSTPVTIPAQGGLVTEPCGRFLIGPTRNCGFAPASAVIPCAPGTQVALHCTGGSAAQPAAVRVCEASLGLGAIPCTYNDALGVVTQSGTDHDLPVTCPAARSLAEPGGLIAVYAAPLLDGDDVSGVTCTIAP